MVDGDKLSEKEANNLLKDYISKGVFEYRVLDNEISKLKIIYI